MCVLQRKTAFYDVDVIIYYGLKQSVLYCLYTVKVKKKKLPMPFFILHPKMGVGQEQKSIIKSIWPFHSLARTLFGIYPWWFLISLLANHCILKKYVTYLGESVQ